MAIISSFFFIVHYQSMMLHQFFFFFCINFIYFLDVCGWLGKSAMLS